MLCNFPSQYLFAIGPVAIVFWKKKRINKNNKKIQSFIGKSSDILNRKMQIFEESTVKYVQVRLSKIPRVKLRVEKQHLG